MIPFEKFCEIAAKIPYQYRHPIILYGLIRWLRPITVVEVGTHLGMSAVWMGRAIQENGVGNLYCIDPFVLTEHDQENQWNRNIDACGLRDHVHLIKGKSQDVEWPAHADMVYVDGLHTFEMCAFDTEKAARIGAEVIAVHDTVSREGSRKYADLMRSSPHWRGWDFIEENCDDGLLITKRRRSKGPVKGPEIER